MTGETKGKWGVPTTLSGHPGVGKRLYRPRKLAGQLAHLKGHWKGTKEGHLSSKIPLKFVVQGTGE